jgi:hypothetical protein
LYIRIITFRDSGLSKITQKIFRKYEGQYSKMEKNFNSCFLFPSFYLTSSSLRKLVSPSVKTFLFTSGSIETVLQFNSCNMYQRIPGVSNCFWLVIFFWLFLQFFCVFILPLSGFVLEAVLSPFLSISFFISFAYILILS